jgi:hypothetical protein
MQMLAAGGIEPLCDDVRPPDAHNPRGYFELAAVRRSRVDTGWLEGAAGRAVKVIHALLPALPRDRAYRVILMRRDLREVVASQHAMLERLRGGEEVLGPDRMIRIFEAQLREVEVWAAETPGCRLLHVDYAALVADPAPSARALAAFLDGGLDLAAMRAAVDPGLYHQRLARPGVPASG